MTGARGARSALLVAAVGAAIVLSASPAWAHSRLTSISPANGAVLDTAPTQVVLTFDENIQDIGDVVLVAGPNGQRFDVGRPVVLNNTATQRLAPLPYRGHYSVTYRVVSADGHPVTQTLGFTMAVGSSAPPATVDPPRSSGDSGGAGGAVVLVGGLVVVCGLLLGGARWVRGRTRRRRTERV